MNEVAPGARVSTTLVNTLLCEPPVTRMVPDWSSVADGYQRRTLMSLRRVRVVVVIRYAAALPAHLFLLSFRYASVPPTVTTAPVASWTPTLQNRSVGVMTSVYEPVIGSMSRQVLRPLRCSARVFSEPEHEYTCPPGICHPCMTPGTLNGCDHVPRFEMAAAGSSADETLIASVDTRDDGLAVVQSIATVGSGCRIA